MRIECGVVSKVEQGRVLVESNPEAFCSSCSAQHGCMMGNTGKSRKIWITTLNAVPGDVVHYGISEKGVILSSALLYIVPVVCLSIGAVMGNGYGGDAGAALGGICGLAVSAVVIKAVTSVLGNNSLFHPVLISINKEKGA